MKKIFVFDCENGLRESLSDLIFGAGGQGSGEDRSGVILVDLKPPEAYGAGAKEDRGADSIVAVAHISRQMQTPSDSAAELADIRRLLESAGVEDLDEEAMQPALDGMFSALSNQTRRRIISLLRKGDGMRLMDISRRLGIEDHTRTIFHMRLLKTSGMVWQDKHRRYVLTREGRKITDCMRMVESFLTRDSG